MAAPRTSDAALERAMKWAGRFEEAGKPVRKVTVEGQRIEIEFEGPANPEAPDNVSWK